jgi:hypothetical protein
LKVVDDVEAKSLRALADELDPGEYHIYTVSNSAHVTVRQVTNTAVSIGGGESWDTDGEEE